MGKKKGTTGSRKWYHVKYIIPIGSIRSSPADTYSKSNKRIVHKVQGKNSFYDVGSLYHTSNRGMIARAKLNGVAGKNSCAKGIEVTKSDLKEIFKSV